MEKKERVGFRMSILAPNHTSSVAMGGCFLGDVRCGAFCLAEGGACDQCGGSSAGGAPERNMFLMVALESDITRSLTGRQCLTLYDSLKLFLPTTQRVEAS
eukprot:s3421_g2.t1